MKTGGASGVAGSFWWADDATTKVRLLPNCRRPADRQPSLTQTRLRDRSDVSQVSTAAAAQDVDSRKPLPKLAMKRRKLGDVARVELAHSIEFRMATARCIRPNTADARRPFCVFIKRGEEVRRMRTVVHVIGRIGAYGLIDSRNRIGEPITGGSRPSVSTVKLIATGT